MKEFIKDSLITITACTFAGIVILVILIAATHYFGPMPITFGD